MQVSFLRLCLIIILLFTSCFQTMQLDSCVHQYLLLNNSEIIDVYSVPDIQVKEILQISKSFGNDRSLYVFNGYIFLHEKNS